MADVRLLVARLRTRGRVRAEHGVRVQRGARIVVAPGARVELGEGCLLESGCRVEARAGILRLGRGTRVGERAVLVALTAIDIGPDAVLGPWVAVIDAEPTFDDPERPTREQPLRTAPIAIGDGAVIGPHAALGPGVRVAPGAVVGAYAVLTTPRSIA